MERETVQHTLDAELLLQEVNMGLTFAQLARDSKERGNAAGAARQKTAAKMALRTILKFLPNAHLTFAAEARIQAGAAELDSKLAAVA